MCIFMSVKAITERTQLQIRLFSSVAWDLTFVCRPACVSSFGARWVGGVLGLDGWVDILDTEKRILLRGERAYEGLCVLGGMVATGAGLESGWGLYLRVMDHGAAALVRVHV